jgi:hypothetical protein
VSGGPTRERRPRAGGAAIDALHLLVLCAFALAAPMYEVIAQSPEFFVARRSTPGQVVAFALAACLGPPAVLVALEAVAGRVSRAARARVHRVLVGVLLALVALRALKAAARHLAGVPEILVSGPVLLALAAIAGALGAAVYVRRPAARSVLTALAPAPLLFVAVLLARSPLRGAELGPPVRAAAPAPIVLVVFDEFPTDSLLDARGRIDRARYPSFAALAGESTWFRNATTVRNITSFAIPAIVTGRAPPESSRPTARDHPLSLFALLRGQYRVEASERDLRLCPDAVCREGPLHPRHTTAELILDGLVLDMKILVPADMTGVVPRLRSPKPHSDAQIDAFVRRIRPGREPVLYFIHLHPPHQPWDRLPSGTRYASRGGKVGGGAAAADEALPLPVSADPGEAAFTLQRHLLQVGYADRVLGRLLARLRATGLYDRSVVVVTADHGVSLIPGAPARVATPETVEQIAGVPLLVKAPGQTGGRIVDRHVRSVDVAPTIADLVRLPLPAGVDGRSALDTATAPPRTVTVRNHNQGSTRVSVEEFARLRRAWLAHKLRLFGAGRSQPGLFGLGPRPDLLGRPISALRPPAWHRVAAAVEQAPALRRVDPRSGFVPALISGHLVRPAGRAPRIVALALNGRVAGSARLRRAGDRLTFELIVPETALRPGRNRLAVYARR